MRESHPSCPAAPRQGAWEDGLGAVCARTDAVDRVGGEEDEQGGGASSCPRRTVFVGVVDELHLSITMERRSIFASLPPLERNFIAHSATEELF
jgi:hypothetical protein